MTEGEDPWRDLSHATDTTSANGRLVDPTIPWAIYWARDLGGHRMLMLRHSEENRSAADLPRLRGLNLGTTNSRAGGGCLTMLVLKDESQHDIFSVLCRDVIAGVRQARTESEAVSRFVSRTVRWHRLLKGGRLDRMSEEEQKGLIGELEVMRIHIIPNVTPVEAVRSWTGPMGAPKDFEIGRVAIEAKGRRGAATPYVAISSADQLEDAGTDELFLAVSEITRTIKEDSSGRTVTQLVQKVREDLEEIDPTAVDLMDERLGHYGFSFEDDYTDDVWAVGSPTLFQVGADFPRIVPRDCPTGVVNVRYQIALDAMARFEVTAFDLERCLKMRDA